MNPIDLDPRFISRLTRQTLGLILAGGRGSRLHELTDWRAKPAVPFGGKFRIIDFPLSNCVNSGIRRIGVLTQYKAHSLIRHLHARLEWLQHELGEFVEMLPASQRTGGAWYAGTADAVYQNLDIIQTHAAGVRAGAGRRSRLQDGLRADARRTTSSSDADMTVSCLEVPIRRGGRRFGVMHVDDSARVRGFRGKTGRAATHSRPAGTVPGLDGQLRVQHRIPLRAADSGCTMIQPRNMTSARTLFHA